MAGYSNRLHSHPPTPARRDAPFTGSLAHPSGHLPPAQPTDCSAICPGRAFDQARPQEGMTTKRTLFSTLSGATDRERSWGPFSASCLAGLGDPAAPKTICLPLLPSGPGGVHRVLLHRAQPLFRLLKMSSSFVLSRFGTPLRLNIKH